VRKILDTTVIRGMADYKAEEPSHARWRGSPLRAIRSQLARDKAWLQRYRWFTELVEGLLEDVPDRLD
jgi:hypothetical protein